MYDNRKISELRDVARSRGLKGWSRLQKSELASFLTENIPTTTSLLDEKIPRNLSSRTLRPTQFIPSKATKKIPTTTKGAKRLSDWENWLLDNIPEAPKKNVSEAKKKILDLYEQKQKTVRLYIPKLKSKAMKGKTQKWFISGEGYKDPWVFLSVVRPDVEKLVDNVKGLNNDL